MDDLREEAARYLRQQRELFGGAVSLPARSVMQGTTRGSEAGAPMSMESAEGWREAETLDALEAMICDCTNCVLGSTRTRFVFGTGNPDADLMVIGEAPGADEDAQGKPFVGAAGQLLTKILGSVNFSRDDVFICNILKCRPPKNRRPEPGEAEQCLPYLLRQIELVRPRMILALGRTAAHTLLGGSASMRELRGVVHSFHGIDLVVTYHPAALLRNPQWKRPVWEDVQRLQELFEQRQ